MAGFFRRIFSKLVYPDGLRCLLCDNELSRDTTSGFCPQCQPEKVTHSCKICGAELKNKYQRYCNSCVYVNSEHYFDFARAPYPYSNRIAKKMVWRLKYGKKAYVAKFMASDMSELVKTLQWDIDFITYVPLHKKRLKKRGYNQSELLATHIGENLGLEVKSTMVKNTYAKVTATKLGRAERIKALENTFSITEKVAGKNILLVDDVITSKATANECAKILKNGKASKVYVITYATSQGDNPGLYKNIAKLAKK
ncbi:MAG: ComF family protein [Clostridia bacterium]|nr:ComF family protein [Clostridia bacterium]